jgi:hypothetical protein
MKYMKSWIVCAANRHKETKLIVCGARHYDPIMRAQMNAMEGFPHWLRCEQGFIDQYGTFLTREEAWQVAKDNDQIRSRCPGDEGKLFSENLY